MAANAEVSSLDARNARGALSEAKAQAGGLGGGEILGHCSKALAALEGLVAVGDASSVSKSISSADVARCGERIGRPRKGRCRWLECMQLAEDGRGSFCPACSTTSAGRSADSSIERETFQERLRSAGLLVPVLGEAAEGVRRGKRGGPSEIILPLVIHLLPCAHRDAIASIDNQDTYNHFGLLHRDPRTS